MIDERPPKDSIASGAFWGRNPHGELAWIRRNDPVYFDEESGVWGISRYEHIKEIESDPVIFSNAGGIRPETGPIPMMIDMDDPEHRMRRKLVARGFTPNRVREQEPAIHTLVHDLVDEVCEAGECDFVWDIAAWVPLIMIGDALGVEPDDRGTLLRWSDDLLRGLGHRGPRSPPQGRRGVQRLHRVRGAGDRGPSGVSARRPHEHPRAQ